MTNVEQIRQEASLTRFQLEVAVLRDDYRAGVNANALANHVKRLARDYGLPPWFIRALYET